MGMISDLPDHMLLEILSWLPTREVVATMLLSRQWKFLWKQVAKLDYDFSQNDGKTFRTLSTGFCSYTRVGFLEVSSYRSVHIAPQEMLEPGLISQFPGRCVTLKST